MDQLGPVGAAMIERLGIAGDQQHLDIAAGTGEPGLTGALPRDMSVPCTRPRDCDVAEWDVAVELVTDSPAQYWEMISEHVSLAVAALAQAGEPARGRIAKAVIAKVSTYEQDGRVRIPGMARCIAGTK
jgi:hypothetical protein